MWGSDKRNGRDGLALRGPGETMVYPTKNKNLPGQRAEGDRVDTRTATGGSGGGRWSIGSWELKKRGEHSPSL